MIQGEIDITVKINEKLMLQALSSYYPYDVVLHFDDALDEEDQILYSLRENGGRVLVNDAYYLLEVKPYLRSMNSMTEEEKDTYDTLTMCNAPWVVVNWLNANKFDYLGLIPMGLAIEAPEGMYNIN